MKRWWKLEDTQDPAIFMRGEREKLRHLHKRAEFLDKLLERPELAEHERAFRRAEVSALNWIVGLLIEIRRHTTQEAKP